MVKDTKFSFGSNPKMREVPPGTEAKFQFNGEPSIVETEWGEKYSFEVTLYSHPSYPNLDSTRPLDTIWQSKSQCAEQLLKAASQGLDDLTKALKEKWKLIRTEEGTYFIEQL